MVPYSTSLSLSSAYTVSLWEQGTFVSSGVTAASQGGPALFSTRNGENNDFDLQVNSDGLHADIGNGTSFLTSAANAIVSLGSVWNMITYAVNTNGYAIYVNGQQVSSGTLSGTPELFTSSAASASIGSQEAAGASYGAGFDSGYFNGAISNVNVFSSTLSAAQVAALYNSSSGSRPPRRIALKPGRWRHAESRQRRDGGLARRRGHGHQFHSHRADAYGRYR